MARKTAEGQFNEELDKKLEDRFPGCEILKLDPMTNYQGILDKIVLYDGQFAILETKSAFGKNRKRPNQDYHVERLKNVGFSAFINPTNCDEVLDEIQSTFGARK